MTTYLKSIRKKYAVCYSCKNIFCAPSNANKTPVCSECKKKGLKNPTSIKAMSEKAKEKVKQTNLEKYGVESHNQRQEVKEKKRKVFQKKYGVDAPAQAQKIKEKIRQTNLENYGTEWVTQSEIFKQKSLQTHRKKYGVDNFSQTEEFKTMAQNFEVDHEKIARKNRENFKNKRLPDLLKKLNISLLSEYIGATEDYKFQCLKCKTIFTNSWANVLQYYKCPTCFPRYQHWSVAEKEIAEYIKTIIPNKIILNNRKILNGKELDIYIPDLKLAFEYNGLYWHSENVGFPPEYHLTKSNMCRDKNINLIHIYEDEWRDETKKIITKNKIKCLLNPKIFSNFEIMPINQKTFIDFCTINLQETNEANNYYGLYTAGEFVSVIGITKNKILTFSTNNKYSKLLCLKCFINYLNFTKIFLHIDLNWDNYNIVTKLGFKPYNNINIGFTYRRQTKNGWQLLNENIAKKLVSKSGLEEFEYCNKFYWNKLWDCGNMIFVKTK